MRMLFPFLSTFLDRTFSCVKFDLFSSLLLTLKKQKKKKKNQAITRHIISFNNIVSKFHNPYREREKNGERFRFCFLFNDRDDMLMQNERVFFHSFAPKKNFFFQGKRKKRKTLPQTHWEKVEKQARLRRRVAVVLCGLR